MKILAESVIDGKLDTVWDIVSDVAGWPAWDPHEEAARIDGPFEAGTAGWSKPRKAPPADWVLTAVEPKKRWASKSGIPGGTILGESTFEKVGTDKVKCVKVVTVSGTLVPLFWLIFRRPVEADLHHSLAALQDEVTRREGASAPKKAKAKAKS